MRILLMVVVIAVLGLMGLSASADMNIGGEARIAAMGGAGLASLDSPGDTATINPAALGVMSKRIGFAFPSVGVRLEGADLGDITDWAGDLWDLSGDTAIEIAQEFGRQDTTLDVYATMGLVGSPLSVTADAEGRARISPNEEFQAYAAGELDPSDPDDLADIQNMEATVTGEAAASLPAVATGFRVPGFASGKGDLWLGARLRWVQGRHIQNTISYSGDPDDPLATSDEPVVEESGIGGDFGLIYRPAANPRLSFGVAVTNLLKPSLGDIAQESLWSVGMAIKPSRKVLVVADLVNITKAYDEGMKFRVGLEVKPVRALALRAGYSGESLTTGISILGIDFAFASRMPLSISRTIRF